MNSQPVKQVADDEIDISSLLREMRFKWYYYLTALVLFMAVTIIYIRFTLPTFEASSSILIEDSKSSPKNIEDILSSDLFGANLNLPTEIGILKSRLVAQQTVKTLGLDIEYFDNAAYPKKPIYPVTPFQVRVDSIDPELRDEEIEVTILDNNRFTLGVHSELTTGSVDMDQSYSFNTSIKEPHFHLYISRNDSSLAVAPGQKYIFKIRGENVLVNDMIEELKVEPLDKDANIVRLVYKDKVAQRAVDILNTIGKVYIDLDIQDKASVAALTLRFVEEQLKGTGDALSANEQEMQAFKERNKTVNLSEESKAVLAKLNEVDIEKVKNNIQLSTLDNLLIYVSTHDDLTSLAPSSLGIPDPLLVELIQSYQQLQAKRKSLSYGVKEITPSIRVIDEQISDVKQSLIENIKSIRSGMTSTDASLQKQLSGIESQVKKVPEMERELLGIQRKFEVNQNIYLYLLQKKAETSIAKATAVSDNKILDAGALADDPVWPSKGLLFGLAALLSGLLPSLYIITRKLLRNTVHSKEDISRLTKVPVLGVVGHSSELHNLVLVHKPKSVIAESFRSIRTNLRFYGIHEKKKVVLITSSVGGEGKSFVTLNLATAFAIQHHKVVVVGMDLRKPRLFQDVGVRNDVGVSNYLIGTATLDQIVKTTSNEYLDLIPAGPVPPNPSELISRPEMIHLIEELKTRYDYIFIDTPPVGIVSDSLILMQHSDINIYIVRQNFSRLDYVRSLNELVKEGKFHNLSILLNDADYGSAYGYGYGYVGGKSGYYEDVAEKPKLFGRIFRKKADTHHLN